MKFKSIFLATSLPVIGVFLGFLLLNGLCQADDEKEIQKRGLMGRVMGLDTTDISSKWKAIRVLVSYSNTNFFQNRGKIKGLEAEFMAEFENFLLKGLLKGPTKIHVVFITLPFNQLIPSLMEGRGDIVAAGLTITPERQKLVAFTDPYIKNVREIIVTSKDEKELRNKRDLSDRTVHVVSGSSYIEHLKELNKQFIQEGLKPIKIVKTDESMESEDLLQMVNAGIFELMVVDQHIAELWSQVLTNMVLRKDLFIHSGGEIAWAVRKNNPKLLEVLNAFARKHRQGTLLGNILLKRYYKNSNWIQNPLTKAEEKKFEKLRNLFQKYAEMYQFDWLKIAALAFQESRLIQNKKSREGAVGIMQIKPATARDQNINIKDVYKMENNIHAGVKYLAFLRDRYFDKPHIDPDSRVDFTFAAYNAGPARINSLRWEAEKMGLDPDKWFFNVEYAARKKIGLETVRYVANVNKYYVAYKSMKTVQEEKTKKIEKLIDSQ